MVFGLQMAFLVEVGGTCAFEKNYGFHTLTLLNARAPDVVLVQMITTTTI